MPGTWVCILPSVYDISMYNDHHHSVHVYPDNWEIPVEAFDWVNVNFIQDRAALAHAAGKPIIIEEFGVRADYHPRGRCVWGCADIMHVSL